jgi:hypothetical protein
MLLSLNCIGQNTVYKGNKTFTATEQWNFECSLEAGIGNLDVQIAKKENGGYLKLDVYSNGSWNYIGGNVTIFLEDGSIITCTDKGIRDEVDGKSIALYSFTNTEMEKLKELDILKIRFSIKAKPGVYDSIAGNYTAKNIKSKSFLDDDVEYFDTSESVKLLYED